MDPCSQCRSIGGIGIVTTFAFDAGGAWTDEAIDLPLAYALSYAPAFPDSQSSSLEAAGVEGVVLQPAGAATLVRAPLPPGNHTALLLILDAHGARARVAARDDASTPSLTCDEAKVQQARIELAVARSDSTAVRALLHAMTPLIASACADTPADEAELVVRMLTSINETYGLSALDTDATDAAAIALRAVVEAPAQRLAAGARAEAMRQALR
jgi:hypothetical protein